MHRRSERRDTTQVDYGTATVQNTSGLLFPDEKCRTIPSSSSEQTEGKAQINTRCSTPSSSPEQTEGKAQINTRCSIPSSSPEQTEGKAQISTKCMGGPSVALSYS